jgi:hypothetical protein
MKSTLSNPWPQVVSESWGLTEFAVCSSLKFQLEWSLTNYNYQFSCTWSTYKLTIVWRDHLGKCHIQRVWSWRRNGLIMNWDHVTCTEFRLTMWLPEICTTVHGCALHFDSAIDNSSIMNVCSLDIESEILVSPLVTYSWIRFVRFRTGAGKGWDKVLLLKSLHTSQSLLWI